MSARETARRAVLALAQATITESPHERDLRAPAVAALKAAGIGHAFLHEGLLACGGSGRELLQIALSCTIVKVCACSAVVSGTEWIRLPLVGIQRFDDGPDALELRACGVCGSSIAVAIPRYAA